MSNPATLGLAESGRTETIMRLTLYTDFALRTLIQVGLNDGKLTTINDIARSFGISKQHLMKVVSRLSQMGYVEAVRGRNGGIRLMREPRHINIGQVVSLKGRNAHRFDLSESQWAEGFSAGRQEARLLQCTLWGPKWMRHQFDRSGNALSHGARWSIIICAHRLAAKRSAMLSLAPDDPQRD